MAAVKPMLDDIELQNVQEIEIDEDQVFVEHEIPALEGDFFQGTGRRATRIGLNGVMTGSDVGQKLKTLREKFKSAVPLTFISDVATATRVDKVLIEDMKVRDIAGKPERFAYLLSLIEFCEAPPAEVDPEVEPPPDQDERIEEGVGKLIVEVIVQGRVGFDHSDTNVMATGEREDGSPFSKTLSDREDNKWTEKDFPAGDYTVEAQTAEPEVLTGSETAHVQAGQTEKVTIILKPGVKVAKMFLVHFWFDKSFIEPCMRHVLKQVAQYAASHSDQKLLIVGHTDKVGPKSYNQSLSERRARSAFAALMFGHNEQAAADEWMDLHKIRPGGTDTSINDTWGAREYQLMLQDLGYYPGNIDGRHGPLTDAAVSEFRYLQGLTPGVIMDDTVWEALIKEYLKQDNLKLPLTSFWPNCGQEILKWIGCGEELPVSKWGKPSIETAWRPYRRVEFLFIKDESLPGEIPQPDTFYLPQSRPVGSEWCVGPDSSQSAHCCLITYTEPSEDMEDKPWLVKFAESGEITVKGTIRFENFAANTIIDFKYILTTSEGEYLNGEKSRGLPQAKAVAGVTDDNGVFEHSFSYSGKPKGIYSLEIIGPFVMRMADQPPAAAKGTVVCMKMDGSADFDVIVNDSATVVSGIKIKGKIFWKRSWDYDTALDLPNVAPPLDPPVKEYLPGAKAELYIQKPGSANLTLFKTIFLTDGTKVEDPHGAFEFTDVPYTDRAAMRILLEYQNNKVVVVKGKTNAVNEPDFKVKRNQVVWHQFDLDVSGWNKKNSEFDYGDIEIAHENFIDICDAYKSIWFGHHKLHELSGRNIELCRLNFPEPTASTSHEQNKQLFILKNDLKDRDVLLHEYAHFIMDVLGNAPDHPGYLFNDIPHHSTASKEHYEAAWIEGPATFMSCAFQNNEIYHDGYDTNLSYNLASDNTTTGPHAEGSIQEALWRIYKTHGTSFKDSFWKAFEDTSKRSKINNVFDFFYNWKELGIDDLDKLLESYKNFNMEYGYTYMTGAERFTAVAAPKVFDAAKKEFQTIEELFDHFGKLGGNPPANSDEYKEEFYNRNKFFGGGALDAGSTHTNPIIVVGEKYIIPKRFKLSV